MIFNAKAGVFIVTVPLVIFLGSCVFEQVRWLWYLKPRRKLLSLCYFGGVDQLFNEEDNDAEKEYLTEEDILAAYRDCSEPELYPKVLGPSADVFKDPKRQKEYSMVRFRGQFINPFWEFCDRNPANFFRYVRWKLTRKNRQLLAAKKPSHLDNGVLDVVSPDFNYIRKIHTRFLNHSERREGLIALTWLGQSTGYVQMDGYSILTDPAFSDVLVNNWIGQRRLSRAPCKISDFPSIDLILVSHDHFDHLDRDIIKVIGNSALWIVPIGLGDGLLRSRGITNYKELGWWESYEIKMGGRDPLLITATPAQHWSGTHFFNVNRSLWCSMFVRGKTSSFFHCGDTGYCSVFKEVKKRIGSPDLAMLPIGTYEPRWYLKYDHISPWEAACTHRDLGAKVSFAVHWGTYNLSDEPMSEPPRLLRLACDKVGIPPDEFIVGKIGGTHSFDFKRSMHVEHYKSN